MTSLGLDPGFFPKHDLKDDHDYVRSHLYQTHDVWHVVTGFNTKVEGELGLQAFYLAQAPMPLPFLVLSAGLLNTMFFNFKNRVLVLDEIVRGWQLGRNAKPLFGTDWVSMWDKPLTAVRADLGITVTNPLAAELKTATLAAAQ